MFAVAVLLLLLPAGTSETTKKSRRLLLLAMLLLCLVLQTFSPIVQFMPAICFERESALSIIWPRLVGWRLVSGAVMAQTAVDLIHLLLQIDATVAVVSFFRTKV